MTTIVQADTEPVFTQRTVTERSQSITAAPGSAGAAVTFGVTTAVTIWNTESPKWDIEYRVGTGAWLAIGPRKSVRLEIDLATTTLALRRGENSVSPMVARLTFEGPTAGVVDPAGTSVVPGDGIPAIGIPASPDFVVDAANGNDDNAGTAAAPWRSLNKIAAAIVTLGATRSVLVKRGTYDKATDFINIQGVNNTFPARTELIVAFEPGCIMDGAAANPASGSNVSAIDFGGTNWIARVYGNGCIVRNYTDTGASSPNGLANRGSQTAHFYDFDVSACDDGISAHDTSRMFTYRLRVRQGEKSAFAHVSTSYWQDEGSEFYDIVGSVNGSSGRSRCIGTKFYPAAGVNNTAQLTFSGATVIQRGRIGTLDRQLRIAHTTAGSRVEVSDSYVNSFVDGRDNVGLTRCFGRFYTRMRSGATAGGLVLKQCVWVGPSSAADVAGGGISFQLDLGASAISCDDTVWFGYGVAIGAGFTSTADGYWNGSGSAVRNNCFFGNTTNIRAGLNLITGSLTVDPQIAAGTGYEQRDYALLAGSPMLGAGVDGGNVGFALSEVPA